MAVNEIIVTPVEGDPEADQVVRQASSMLGVDVDGLGTSSVYYIEGDLSQSELVRLGESLGDPVTDQVEVNPNSDDGDNVRVVSYRKEMVIPQEESLLRVANLLRISVSAVGLATEYRFPRDVDGAAVGAVTDKILVNDSVQVVQEHTPDTLKIVGSTPTTSRIEVAGKSDAELEEISSAQNMYLNLDEMRVVRDYFEAQGREATDAELQTIGAAWSEHCVHKTFKAKIIAGGQEKAPFMSRIRDTSLPYFERAGVETAFIDNAGGIRFGDDHVITIKVETHNSPSGIEPYGGAATGSGGVFRDILGVGKGGKVIASLDMFGLAPPQRFFDISTGEYRYIANYDTPPKIPDGTIHPEHMIREVIRGVGDYGNRMGIPTINGSFHFNELWVAKPTVMVGAVGIQPIETIEKGEPRAGDLVVSFGGLTGRDGINGATFSSESMDTDTGSKHSNAVQIGDPITEKKVQDLIIEARDNDCFIAITDCGAAGFASAVGEIGEDTGVDIDLANAQLKYEGLAPWEIWVSESQERMVAAIDPSKIDEFRRLAEKYEVHMDVLGEFTDDNNLTVRYQDETIIDLDYDFLNNGLPQRVMEANWQAPEIEERTPETPIDHNEWSKVLHDLLGHENICSKQGVVERYDTEVQGGTIVKPYGGELRDAPNNGAVLKPLHDSRRGVVIAHGMNPELSLYDPYNSGRWAFAEAVANFVASGGNPDKFAVCGNYVSGKPNEQVLGALDLAVDGVNSANNIYKAPTISGKDSLSSTFVDKEGTEHHAPIVTTITVVGEIEDISQTMTTEIKQPGKSKLVMVGTRDVDAMGGSAYYDIAQGSSSEIPKIEDDSLETMRVIHQAIKDKQILACHDVSEGGIAVAVAEMCFGGNSGARLNLSGDSPQNQLFNETPGVFVVEVDDDMDIEEMFGHVDYEVIGETARDGVFVVAYEENELMVSEPTENLKKSWKRSMEFLDDKPA